MRLLARVPLGGNRSRFHPSGNALFPPPRSQGTSRPAVFGRTRCALVAVLLIASWLVPAAAQPLVRTEGKAFIAPDGSTLLIKGISLGNWLMPEGYMFKFDVANAPRQIYGAFERLLGPERAKAFWTAYRDTYIRQDDIRFIKSVGFNTVRIPLHYALFMTADGTATGEGWALLDRVLGWARDAWLYASVD